MAYITQHLYSRFICVPQSKEEEELSSQIESVLDFAKLSASSGAKQYMAT